MRLWAAGLAALVSAGAVAQLPNSDALRQPVELNLDNVRLSEFLRKETKNWATPLKTDGDVGLISISAEGTWPSWTLFLNQVAELLGAEWKDVTLQYQPRLAERLEQRAKLTSRSVREGWSEFRLLRQTAAAAPEQLQIELRALQADVDSLRRDRPNGWSESLEPRLERMERQIRPLLDNPLLHALLRQSATKVDGRWDEFANRFLVTARHRGEEVTWVADSPAGAFQPLNQERIGLPLRFAMWSLPAGQATRPWNAEIPFAATDADVARFAARAAGMRFIAVDGRVRDLTAELPMGLTGRDLRAELERRSQEPSFGLGMVDGTVLLRPETSLQMRRNWPISDVGATVEQTGGYDLEDFFFWASFVQALGMEDHLGKRISPRFELRATAPFWLALRLLWGLSADQKRQIEAGQPVPWHTLPTELAEELLATQQPFAERGEGWREAALNDPEKRKGLFLYFERLVRIVERAPSGPGLTLQGGINDGVGQTSRPAAQLYETEFSVYLGYRFDESIVIRGWLTSAVRPPEPVLEKGAAPPKGHEGAGHGPDSECPLCNPR